LEGALDNREGTIIVLEDGLVASEHTLGRVCMERDDEHAQAEVVQLDYLARMHAFMFGSKHSINFSRT
jgi:hypothetical protein